MVYLVLMLALAMLPVTPAGAQEDDRLEAWQERILRSLEDAEADPPGREGEPSNSKSRQSYSRQPGTDAGAAKAAEEARRLYGGQALAVVRVGDAYRVRLLLDSGRVTTVTIRD